MKLEKIFWREIINSEHARSRARMLLQMKVVVGQIQEKERCTCSTPIILSSLLCFCEKG
jgi:hypothetical protein